MTPWLTRLIVSVVVAGFAQAVVAKVSSTAHGSGHGVEELTPYDKSANARADLNAALDRARARGTRVLLVMGANWCHDSRGLATRFATPDFTALIDEYYELVYVDVGQKNRNIDIAQDYGIESIVGTPTVLILTADNVLLNRSTAPTWRNADSRSHAETLTYFTAYASGPIVEAR